MDAKQRREEILRLLQMDMKPLSASRLGERFEVSRQIIVGDIALLRACGEDIVATSRGYVLSPTKEDSTFNDSYVIACRHDKSMLSGELYAVVDNGGCFLNVSIEHKIYETISCDLNISNRFEADNFLKKVAMSSVPLLSALTDGVHFHTIRCPSAEAYRRILSTLKDKGVLYSPR